MQRRGVVEKREKKSRLGHHFNPMTARLHSSLLFSELSTTRKLSKGEFVPYPIRGEDMIKNIHIFELRYETIFCVKDRRSEGCNLSKYNQN